MQGNGHSVVLNKKYKLLEKIGSGSFGSIYMCQNIDNHEIYAAKIEKKGKGDGQLQYEIKLYQLFQGINGMCKLIDYGNDSDHERFFMIIQLLGQSLEDLFQLCGKKFSLATTLNIGIQIITRLQQIHRKGFVHRDIKANNFMIGKRQRAKIVYIIDFGLAKRYKDLKTGLHIPVKGGKSLVGTARYASIASHQGFQQCRRDDLESLGYLLLYFLRGKLPWQGIQIQNKTEKYSEIGKMKKQAKLQDLCLQINEDSGSFIIIKLYYTNFFRAQRTQNFKMNQIMIAYENYLNRLWLREKNRIFRFNGRNQTILHKKSYDSVFRQQLLYYLSLYYFLQDMQKLFYVVCKWLQSDESKQSQRIGNMIKQDMQIIGFRYEDISNTQRQRQQLYRQRQKLIKQKQKLQQHKRQIQRQRQENLRLMQQRERLQQQKYMMEQKIQKQKTETQQIKEQNEQLEQKRQYMLQQYSRLQQQRSKILQERDMLKERMYKIEKLQQLQRQYQDQLRRLKSQAEDTNAQEQKEQEELQNQMGGKHEENVYRLQNNQVEEKIQHLKQEKKKQEEDDNFGNNI